MHDSTETTPIVPKRPSAWLLVGVPLVVGGLIVVGVLPKLRERAARANALAAADRPPLVVVAAVAPAKADAELSLPATARAVESTVLYAKTTGFIGTVRVDLGSRVKAGDLLATIEVPERDDELRLAAAHLSEAQKNEKLATVQADRYAALAKNGVVTPQEAESFALKANSQTGAVESNAADLKRLATLKAYQRVVAPFDGTVVRRLVDRGALVGSGTSALFEIGRVDALKLLVDVPQSFADAVRAKPDEAAVVQVRGGGSTLGKVVRIADALDLDNHTLRAEVQIPGDKGVLAGMFATVTLHVKRQKPPMIVPSSALLIRKEGPRVWVMDDAGKVTPRGLVMVRDLGKEIEVEPFAEASAAKEATGLRPGERVVLHPPDELTPGGKVETKAQ